MEDHKMKHTRNSVHSKYHKILIPEFEDQQLTSFSGIVIFQALFSKLDLKSRLSSCFKHMKVSSIFGNGLIMLLLIMHLLLGFRRLRDIEYYNDDPMVKRVLGLKIIPNVSTISRSLAVYDEQSIHNIRLLSQKIVFDRLSEEKLPRITLDFDGTVQSTMRHAEGTAVGFNKKKKGARSYYPLLCTLAQTSQVLDIHHRPGNVHDSNGAKDFMVSCIELTKKLPFRSILELRADSAFFNEEIIDSLDEQNVEFTISVPFARFPELKDLVENRKRWQRFNHNLSYFETDWKPKSWKEKYRFLFIRTRTKVQKKEPIQLDLFEPYDYEYEFKVIVTNKSFGMDKVLQFHNGRGSQEALISELKTHCQCDLVPVRKRLGNQAYLFAGIIAHNLNRELQMVTQTKQRKTTAKRTALWKFKQLSTIRGTIIQRAGRLTRPQGKLKLTMSANEATKKEITHFLNAIVKAA
jgi:hypothetical protein